MIEINFVILLAVVVSAGVMR